MMMPRKDQQKFIEKQPDPSQNVTKAINIYPIPGDDDMGQHISPINKP